MGDHMKQPSTPLAKFVREKLSGQNRWAYGLALDMRCSPEYLSRTLNAPCPMPLMFLVRLVVALRLTDVDADYLCLIAGYNPSSGYLPFYLLPTITATSQNDRQRDKLLAELADAKLASLNKIVTEIDL